MNCEKQIERAKNLLKKRKNRLGTRGSRFHEESLEKYSKKLHALKSQCGDCRHLNLYFKGKGRSEAVGVGCKRGLKPAVVFADVLDLNTNCNLFEERD